MRENGDNPRVLFRPGEGSSAAQSDVRHTNWSLGKTFLALLLAANVVEFLSLHLNAKSWMLVLILSSGSWKSWALQIRGRALCSLIGKTKGSGEINSVVLSKYEACDSLFPLSISGSRKRSSLDSDPDGCLACWRVAGRPGLLPFLPSMTHIFSVN